MTAGLRGESSFRVWRRSSSKVTVGPGRGALLASQSRRPPPLSAEETPCSTPDSRFSRNFWYAALPAAELDEGPKPFRILGQDVVLFLDAVGEPAAVEDRCCHRTAKLSKGWIKNGPIVCGYHGWEYDRSGKLTTIPQFPFEQAAPDARARSFHAKTRYG